MVLAGNGVGNLLGVGIGTWLGAFCRVGNSFCFFGFGVGIWIGIECLGCELVCLFFFFLLVVWVPKSHTSMSL